MTARRFAGFITAIFLAGVLYAIVAPVVPSGSPIEIIVSGGGGGVDAAAFVPAACSGIECVDGGILIGEYVTLGNGLSAQNVDVSDAFNAYSDGQTGNSCSADTWTDSGTWTHHCYHTFNAGLTVPSGQKICADGATGVTCWSIVSTDWMSAPKASIGTITATSSITSNTSSNLKGANTYIGDAYTDIFYEMARPIYGTAGQASDFVQTYQGSGATNTLTHSYSDGTLSYNGPFDSASVTTPEVYWQDSTGATNQVCSWSDAAGKLSLGDCIGGDVVLEPHEDDLWIKDDTGALFGSITVGDVRLTDVTSGVSHALCKKADNWVGWCSDAVNASGVCTCN